MKMNIGAIAFLIILFGSYIAAAIYMWRHRVKNPDEECPPGMFRREYLPEEPDARKPFCSHSGEKRRISGGVQDPGDVQCLDCGKWEECVINPKDWSKSKWRWTNNHPYGSQGRKLDSSNPFIEKNTYYDS